MMEDRFQPGDLAQHFKRTILSAQALRNDPNLYLYDIVGTAEHTETGEKLMIYRPRYGEKKLYARPLEMFLSPVDSVKYPDVKQKYRFEKIDGDKL